MKISVTPDVVCPVCKAEEKHPTNQGEVQIRGFKVQCTLTGRWKSQCLVCSGGYDKVGGTFYEANHNPIKGWFIDRGQV